VITSQDKTCAALCDDRPILTVRLY